MMQHMDSTEKARFAALLKHYKATRPPGDGKAQQAQPKNANSHAHPSDPKAGPPRLLEVGARESPDALQRQSRSLLRENSNSKTNRGKLRHRQFRGMGTK